MSYQQPEFISLPKSKSQVDELFLNVMRRVYVWMCLGLFLTAGVAIVVVNSPFFSMLVEAPLLFFGLIIGELILVFVLSSRINRLSVTTATTMFFVYAALNGVTLSVIFVVYSLGNITIAFIAAASLFGAMSIIGYTTEMDLSQFRGILFMGLIGLIIASIANIFLASSALDWIITYAGIFLFLGLTVYDTQRIKRQMISALNRQNEQVIERVGLFGALRLYLDFVNLFLYLLRLVGRRRN